MQEARFSPAEILARYINSVKNENELFLLTGERGSGKSSWCLELIHMAQSAGIEPAGLLSPAVFEQEVKIGIDLVNISTGEHRRLAVKREYPTQSTQPTSSSAAMDWQFDTGVLDWGNQILADLCVKSELLILDELGPLEFVEKRGLVTGMKLIDRKGYKLACVVMRPALLEKALNRWPWAMVITSTNQPAEIDQR